MKLFRFGALRSENPGVVDRLSVEGLGTRTQRVV